MVNNEYFVTYIDEYGIENDEVWTQSTLDTELERGNVKILIIDRIDRQSGQLTRILPEY
jgi:hypothetical protein